MVVGWQVPSLSFALATMGGLDPLLQLPVQFFFLPCVFPEQVPLGLRLGALTAISCGLAMLPR